MYRKEMQKIYLQFCIGTHYIPLTKEIYDRCQRETNKFGMGCYYHIVAVVKNAKILAEKYGADKEVVLIAA